MTKVYLKKIDADTPNECWVMASKGDPGAIAFVMEPTTMKYNRLKNALRNIPDWHVLAVVRCVVADLRNDRRGRLLGTDPRMIYLYDELQNFLITHPQIWK